jgi:hypothetical protein
MNLINENSLLQSQNLGIDCMSYFENGGDLAKITSAFKGMVDSPELKLEKKIELMEKFRQIIVIKQAKDNPEQAFKFYAKKFSNSSSFLNACRLGYLELLKIFVSNGVMVGKVISNDTQTTALHHASDTGHTDVVKWLCEHPGLAVDSKDKEGLTALHYALKKSHTRVAKVLIENKANLYALSNAKITPFKCAPFKVKVLLSSTPLKRAGKATFCGLSHDLRLKIYHLINDYDLYRNCRRVCRDWHIIITADLLESLNR